MNKKSNISVMSMIMVLIFSAAFVVFSCDITTNETPEQDQTEKPTTPDLTTQKPTTPDPVDPAFWFGEIYTSLINRVGKLSTDGYPDITESSGVDSMSQIVNCQYVCDAINSKWGTSYTPASETASKAANCEYFLKMVDKANGDKTTYGTGIYATTQVIDKTAVDNAINTLWVSGSAFVAVDQGSDKAAYSTDGITWTAVTLSSSANWNSVTYGNGKFVAVPLSNNIAAYSTDGITWTTTALPSNKYWYSVTYGNDKFVAVAESSNAAAYSTDGIAWTAATLSSDEGWSSATYCNRVG
ncbi:hypothetical protein FACS1894142_5290 [Spirochaetia bacterium]|nr:hypothetical protein FACS1894142_5290 [Spirochaetia bacterium]